MYRGIVEPHFSYCCSVWGCCSETKLNSLQKIQNRAARITTNSPYNASVAPLLQNLGWPSIKDLIRKETVTLTYKALNSLALQYLGELFRKFSEGSDRILRSTETNLQIPLLGTSAGQKAFSYRGAKLWNALNKETKLASSLATNLGFSFLFLSCTGQFVKQLFITEICSLFNPISTGRLFTNFVLVGGVFHPPPPLFSETTRSITIRLTPIVL